MMIDEKKCKLKKCIKEAPIKIKEKIVKTPLNFLAGFFYGAFTIFFIQWVAFSGHITPPGVSATVACMALAFTIYAAFKVKEWSETKINEKGFKKCEEYMDHFGELVMKFSKMNFETQAIIKQIKRIKKQKTDDFIPISEAHDSCEKILIELQSLTIQMPFWGFYISDQFDINTFNDLYSNYLETIESISIRPGDKSEYDEEKIIQNNGKLQFYFEEMSKFIEITLGSSFDEVFKKIDKKKKPLTNHF